MEKNKTESISWYFRSWAIVITILAFGPLGLPLLWFRPKVNVYLKISISILVLAATGWMAITTAKYYRMLLNYYNELSQTIAGM